MSLIEKLYELLFPVDEPETEQPEPDEKSDPVQSSSLSITMFEPRRLNAAKEIIACMSAEDHAAFVSLARLSAPDARRLTDILCGAAMALSGEVRTVDTKVILCCGKTSIAHSVPENKAE